MKLPGACGGTYAAQSGVAAAERSMNWYPERNGASAPENGLVMVPTPGLSVFAALPGETSVAAEYADPVTGRMFAIGGTGTLYEISATGTVTSRGSLGTAGGPYSFASNNSSQVLISAAGVGYLLQLIAYLNTTTGVSLAANSLTPVLNLSSEFLGSAQCAQMDDYFISLVPASRQFQISSPLDGTEWDGLDFGAASGGADNVIAFNVSHRELWLFTKTRVEIYVDDGAANFPFERLNGTYLDTGCTAAGSVVRMDNTLFWLGQDERGQGIIWRANGYTPQRISNHSVEYFIGEYAKNGGISNAAAYSYQDGGHTFYVLHFPSATIGQSATGGVITGVTVGATWVYDASTSLWHERSYLDNGVLLGHLARSHAFGFGQHLVGDWRSGNIYAMSSDYYDDAGAVIRRFRRPPVVESEDRVLFHGSLEALMDVGAGNTNDPNPQGFLRCSNDGGKTWSSERAIALGAQGEYQTRVRWIALGSARRRQYEFATTARVPVTLVDAFIELTVGTS